MCTTGVCCAPSWAQVSWKVSTPLMRVGTSSHVLGCPNTCSFSCSLCFFVFFLPATCTTSSSRGKKCAPYLGSSYLRVCFPTNLLCNLNHLLKQFNQKSTWKSWYFRKNTIKYIPENIPPTFCENTLFHLRMRQNQKHGRKWSFWKPFQEHIWRKKALLGCDWLFWVWHAM